MPAPREARVRTDTVERLLNINREFYQSFAEPFMATRSRLQPGVIRSLESVPLDALILDLGCAHGVLAQELKTRGFSGWYVGLDASRPLIESVSRDLQPPRFQFRVADFEEEDWPGIAGDLILGEETDRSRRFDWVFAFAVLHHLPSKGLRSAVLGDVRPLLSPRGRLSLSVWDFLASERLRERIVPWETVDIREEDVDTRDHLVDWREGGRGVRYVHHFSPEELEALADETGYRVVDEFRSDGENGRLGLYQVWEVF